MTLLHDDFAFFAPPRYQSLFAVWQFQRMSAAEVMICWKLFISSLIRVGSSSGSVSFSVSWSSMFSWLTAQFVFLACHLFGDNFELLCYCLGDFYGKMISVVQFFWSIPFWAICGLEKVRFIVLDLPFLVLKCGGEPMFTKIKSWFLSRFPIVFPLLSVLVDPQRAWWLSPDRISGTGSWATKSSRSCNSRGKLLGM